MPMDDAKELITRVASVMEDPSAQAVARVYANAFLGAAAAIGEEAALEECASFLNEVIAKNPQFEAILLSGIVGRDDKVSLIDRVVGPFGSEMFTNFLRVLARHDRLDLLPLILEESRLRYETLSGRKRVQVTSAVELSRATLDRIYERLNAALPFEPILEPETDARLLGGAVIRIGDTVYDSSLSTRLRQLRDRLRQRSLHEIQSGRDRFSHPEGD